MNLGIGERRRYVNMPGCNTAAVCLTYPAVILQLEKEVRHEHDLCSEKSRKRRLHFTWISFQ